MDASVALACCFADEQDPYSTGVLRLLGTWEALAPAIWPLEVANALAVAERRGRLKPARTRELAAEIEALGVVLDSTTWRLASGGILDLAREYGLSAYDAAYLELALRERTPLATRDDALTKAARKLRLPPLPDIGIS